MSSNDFIIRIVLDAQSKIAPVLAAAAAEAKKLEDRFKGVDNAGQGLDRRLAQLEAGTSKMRDTMRSLNPTLDSVDRKFKGISETSTRLSRNFGVVERASAKAGGALSGLGSIVESLDKKLKDLDRKMTEMGARTYSPKLNVDGVAAANISIDALSLKLLALERKRRTVKLGIEKEILDREIAEVEAKFEKLGSEGIIRRVRVKYEVDQESQNRILESNRKVAQAKLKDAQNELDDLRKQLAEDAKLREDYQKEDAARAAEAEARRHVRLQQEEADQKATIDRIEREIEKAAKRRAERDKQAVDDEKKRRAGVESAGDRLGSTSDRLQDRNRTAQTFQADIKGFDEAREELRAQARAANIDIPIGVKLSMEDRAQLEGQLLRLGMRREHIKVLLDYEPSEIERFGVKAGLLFQNAFSKTAAAGGGLGGADGGAGLANIGGLRNAAYRAAIVFAEPLLSALTAVAGALIAVGSAAGQAIAGLAGMAVAAGAQAVPVLGILALAISRVAAVVKVASLAQAERDKGQQQGAAIDNTRANAQDALAQAHQGVKNALDQLSQAERGVGDAQLRVIDAQDQLNQARRDGIRTLEDLLLAEQRANLSADQSELSLAMRVATGGGSLVQSEQLQAQSDRTDASRQTKDTREAVAGGVNSLPAVVSAQKGVDDAVRGVDNAKRAVAQAAQGVDNARKQVAQAERGLDAASEKMGAAASAYEIALGKLSGGERVLLRSIENFKQLFGQGSEIRKISDIIVVSFAGALDRVADLFRDNKVLAAFKGLATALSEAIDDTAKFLTSGPMRAALIFFTGQASKNIGTVGSIFRNLITIFSNIARAAAGPLASSLKGVDGWLGGIADKTSPGKASGLRKFFDDALDPIKSFLKLGGAVVDLFLALVGSGGAAEEGTRGIDGLTKSVDKATAYVRANGKEVQKFFHDSIDATGDILRVFVGLGAALVKTFDPHTVKQFADFLTKTVIPVLAGIVMVLGVVASAIFAVFNNDAVSKITQFTVPILIAVTAFELLASGIGRLIVWLTRGRIAATLYSIATTVMTAATMVFAGEATILEGVLLALEGVNPFVWVAAAIVGLVLLYKHSEKFRSIIDSILDFVKGHWQTIAASLFGPIGWAVLEIVKHFDKIKHVVTDVTGWFANIAGKIFSPFKGAFGKLKQWADDAFGYVKDKFNAVAGFLGLGGDSKLDKMVDEAAAKQRAAQAAAQAAQTRRDVQPLDALGRGAINADDNFRIGSTTAQPKAKAPSAAKKSALANIDKQIDYFDTVDAKVSPEEATQIKKLWQDIVRSTDVSTGKIADLVRAMRVAIENTIDRLVRVVGNDFDKLNHEARVAWHDFNDSATSNLEKFTDAFKDAMQSASKTAFDGFKYISDAANKALKAYDAKPVSINLTPPAERKASGGIVGVARAVGGWIGQQGERGQDAVHTILGRGEAVLNFAQQKLVEPALQATYGFGIDGMFQRVRGEHGAPAAGGMATGGRAGGANFNGHPDNVSSPIRSLIAQLQERFSKLQVTSTTDHGLRSSSGGISFHSSGRAVDIAADAGYMNMVASWIKSSGLYKKLAEGIHNPNLAVKYGKLVDGPSFFAGGGVWGQHLDHIHLALTEGIGKLLGGTSSTEIKTPKVQGTGALAGTTQSVLQQLTKAANKVVEKAGSSGDIDDAPVGGGSAGSSATVRRWATEALNRTNHYSAANLDALVGRIMFESGGNPKAINLTDSNAAAGHPSKGLGQTIDSTFQAYRDKTLKNDIYDPVANLVASINYMFARYGHIMGNTGVGYASGGLAGIAKGMGLAWGGEQATGGDYIVSKPTMFVAGEAGAERATFQPMASGGRAGGDAPDFAPSGSITSGDLSRLTAQLLSSPKKVTERVKQITDLLTEFSERQLMSLRGDLTSAIRGSKKGDFRNALVDLQDSVRKYLFDPLKVLEAGLLRFQGFTNVKGIDKVIDDTSDAVARINSRVNEVVGHSSKKAVARLDDGLTKMGKALDFISGEQGPLAVLEQQISNRTGRAARLLTNKQFKGGKRTTLSDQAIYEQTDKNLDEQRAGLEAEATDINRMMRTAQSGLKNARTEKQRQLFRGTIANLVNRRASVADTLATNAQQIVEAAESFQNDQFSKLGAFYDRIKAGIDRGKRLLTAQGVGGTTDSINAVYTVEANALVDQLNALPAQLASAKTQRNAELVKQIQDKIADLNVQIVELAAQRIQDLVSAAQTAFDRNNSNTDISNRVQLAFGLPHAEERSLDQRLANNRKLGQDLRYAQFQAGGISTEAGQKIEEQIKGVDADYVVMLGERGQIIMDAVNKAAQSRETTFSLRDRMSDLQDRVGDPLGAMASRRTVLTDRNDAIRDTRRGLEGALANANGNGKVIEAINAQLADLNVQQKENTQALKDNTDVTRKLSLDIVTGRSSRATGLIGSAGSIMGTLATISGASTVDAQRSALEATKPVIQTEAAGITTNVNDATYRKEFETPGLNILSQLSAAFQSGPSSFANALLALAPSIADFEATLKGPALDSFQDLVDSMTRNTVAQVENTNSLKNLGTTMAQTFSSSAWTTFRQAIFDGNGGLLPQYSIPAMDTGGMIVRDGMAYLHANERVIPASVVRDGDTMGGMHVDNINVEVTEPMEVLDENIVGKRIVWGIASAGRL